MIIRQEKIDDYKTVYAINKEAFGQKDESELIDRIRKGTHFVPELSLVAEIEGQIVGHILFSKIKIKAEVDFETLALAPIAVLPESQKKALVGSS